MRRELRARGVPPVQMAHLELEANRALPDSQVRRVRRASEVQLEHAAKLVHRVRRVHQERRVSKVNAERQVRLAHRESGEGVERQAMPARPVSKVKEGSVESRARQAPQALQDQLVLTVVLVLLAPQALPDHQPTTVRWSR